MQKIETPVIWDAIALIIWRHCYEISNNLIKYNLISRQTDSSIQFLFHQVKSNHHSNRLIRAGLNYPLNFKGVSSDHTNAIDNSRYEPTNRDCKMQVGLTHQFNALFNLLCWLSMWLSTGANIIYNIMQPVFRITRSLTLLRCSGSFNPIGIYKMNVSCSIIPRWLTRLLCFGVCTAAYITMTS